MPSSSDCERRVEHDGLGVGVVEQVDDLLGSVPVVRVHGREAALERPDVGLEVLDPVVEVGGHLRLLLETGVEKVGRECVGAPVELAPRGHSVAAHLTGRVGDRPGDLFVDVGEVPVGHVSPRGSSVPRDGSGPCAARSAPRYGEQPAPEGDRARDPECERGCRGAHRT